MSILKRFCTDSGVNPLLKRFLLALVVLVLGACVAPELDDLTVESAWIRSMPPGSKMTAAYFKLTNNSTEVIRIIEVRSSEFSSASFHQTVISEEGVASMEEIPILELEPGDSVSLEPGGKHLMLMGGQFAEIPEECCVIRLEIEDRNPLMFHARMNRYSK